MKATLKEILLSLILFQIGLLLHQAAKGLHKYFFLSELDLLERYGGAGSWVVITGASSGQGADLAQAFAHRGFNLLLIGSKRTDEIQTLLNAEYPDIKIRVLHKDFRQAFQDDFFTDIEQAFADLGADLAVLINNVGHRVGWNPYHEMDAHYIRDTIATGTLVQSRLTHMAIPYFLKRQGTGTQGTGTQGTGTQGTGTQGTGTQGTGTSGAGTSGAGTSALINITAQCIHPNFLFGLTLGNEISVPYLSVYEAANAFGFYQGNSIFKEYQGQFDILNITPGAVVTKNTQCLSDTIFNVPSEQFVQQILKMLGQVQGYTCAYWGHALSNYLINFAPNMKDGMLKKVGETLAADFMRKSRDEAEQTKYNINAAA